MPIACPVMKQQGMTRMEESMERSVQMLRPATRTFFSPTGVRAR